jgi:hypothetical protein
LVQDTATTAQVMALIGQKYRGAPVPSEHAEAALRVASKRIVVRITPVDEYSWDHTKLGGRY